MSGTYSWEPVGDTYQVWWKDEDGDDELLAEGLLTPRQVADVMEAHARQQRAREDG